MGVAYANTVNGEAGTSTQCLFSEVRDALHCAVTPRRTRIIHHPAIAHASHLGIWRTTTTLPSSTAHQMTSDAEFNYATTSRPT